MAETPTVLVTDLLPAHIDGLAAGVESHVKEHPSALANLGMGLIKAQADRQIRGALHIDAFDLLARAWSAAEMLHAYTDEKAHPRGQTEITYLAEHTLTATVHPVLQISVAGLALPPMRFALVLTALFQAAALSIRDGTLVAAAPGDASATAQLKYRDMALHDPIAPKRIHLPGLKTFDPGLRIP